MFYVRYLPSLVASINIIYIYRSVNTRRYTYILFFFVYILSYLNMFKCNKCPSVFNAKRNLTAHKKTHLGIRFLCTVCSTTFKYKSGLNRHLTNIHGIVEVPVHKQRRQPAEPAARESVLQFASPVTSPRGEIQIAPPIIVPDIPAGGSNMISDNDNCMLTMDADEILDANTVKNLKLKRKNIRDTFRKKCIQKSGQAANKCLRPTIEHRSTESNVIESEPEEESEVESEIVRNVEDPDVSVDDSEVESLNSRQQMSVKRKIMYLEDNLLQMLEGRKVEDPVSSFLMSLAPQIRKLCQEKQNQVFIEFLQAIQRVSSTNPNQSTHIPPTNNNVYSLPIQHPTPTCYDRSYNTYPTAINHHSNQLDITPASSSLTSSGLDTNQSVSAVVCAANPHQYFNYNTNLSQKVTAPGIPSTIPLFKTEED